MEIDSSAAKIGYAAETLGRRVRQQEGDTGKRPSPTIAQQDQIKLLEREVRELRKTNEIWRGERIFLPRPALDRRFKP